MTLVPVVRSAPDPMDLLQRIHADVKLLRELAGDALVIEIRPASAPAPTPAAVVPIRKWRTDSSAAAGANNRALVLGVFTADPSAWLTLREVAVRLEVKPTVVKTHLQRLLGNGSLQHNGRSTKASGYRLAPAPDSPEGRALERDQRDADRRENEEVTAMAPNGQGTLLGVALQHLAFEPSTATELAATMRIDVELAGKVLARLERDDDLERRGRRKGEVIYGGRS